MKKCISLFLALCLVFSFSVLSFAEEPTAYNWSEVEDIVRNVFGDDGSFFPIDVVDAEIWLPGILSPLELSDADKADGCVGFYSSASGDKHVMIYYADPEGLTLDSFYNYLLQQGSDIYRLSVNGIPAVYLRDTEKNSSLVVFQTQEKKFLEVSFAPLAGEEVFQYSVMSIRPQVEEVASEPVVPVNPVSGLISK